MQGIDEEQFMAKSMLQDAVIRQISIIGEAGTHLSQDMREEHPEIPWRKIIGMRNLLMHENFGVDMEYVYITATQRIPELSGQVQQILSCICDS